MNKLTTLALILTTAAAPADQAQAQTRTHQTTKLHLPAPTGPNAIGTVTQHLVDHSRHAPWKPAQPYRELMVNLVYPARDTTGHPVARQMTKGVARGFDRLAGPGNDNPPMSRPRSSSLTAGSRTASSQRSSPRHSRTTPSPPS